MMLFAFFTPATPLPSDWLDHDIGKLASSKHGQKMQVWDRNSQSCSGEVPQKVKPKKEPDDELEPVFGRTGRRADMGESAQALPMLLDICWGAGGGPGGVRRGPLEQRPVGRDLPVAAVLPPSCRRCVGFCHLGASRLHLLASCCNPSMHVDDAMTSWITPTGRHLSLHD